MKVKVAVAQYQISFHNHWKDYEEKVTAWVKEASDKDGKILLFPEYSTLEITSLFSQGVYRYLDKQLEAMQQVFDKYIKLFQGLAAKFGCYIQAGTFPVCDDSGQYHNHAYFFMPDGQFDYQPKLIMTRFENEEWGIKSGEQLKVFNTDYGIIGINVCYDSEFPMFARKQVEAGADLILVPSCTDTLTGYYRVRIACQARALENQCYVFQSPTVGNALWNEAVDNNVGAAAIFTPIDKGFPDNGIFALGELNKPQWIHAEIDLDKIAKVRKNGQVFNYRDWPRQFDFLNSGE